MVRAIILVWLALMLFLLDLLLRRVDMQNSCFSREPTSCFKTFAVVVRHASILAGNEAS